MKEAFYLIIFVLSISCKTGIKKEQDSTTTKLNNGVEISITNFKSKDILSTLFSSKEFTKSESYVKFKPTVEDKTILPLSDNGFVYSKLDTIIYFKIEDKEFAITILSINQIADETADSPLDCHACSPAIGIALFSLQKDSWKLEKFKKFIEFSGSWGKRGEIKVLKLSENRYGLVTISSFDGMGYFNEITTIYSLNEYDYFDNIFKITTLESSVAAHETIEESRQITKNITFVLKNGNLSVKVSGFIEGNIKINKIYNYVYSEETKNYILD